jgi:hypothetical protein
VDNSVDALDPMAKRIAQMQNRAMSGETAGDLPPQRRIFDPRQHMDVPKMTSDKRYLPIQNRQIGCDQIVFILTIFKRSTPGNGSTVQMARRLIRDA